MLEQNTINEIVALRMAEAEKHGIETTREDEERFIIAREEACDEACEIVYQKYWQNAFDAAKNRGLSDQDATDEADLQVKEEAVLYAKDMIQDFMDQ